MKGSDGKSPRAATANDRATPRRHQSGTVTGHPLRVRILEVANEYDVSPIRFIREGLALPEELQGLSEAEALTKVAYHFRTLEKFKCLRIVDRQPRRGATESTYRGTARAYFTDEEWVQLSPDERVCVSQTMYHGLTARAEGALRAGTFDSRPNRHLTWFAIEVDDRGWDEVMHILANAFRQVFQIKHDAADRLAASGDSVIPLTVGMLGFESPPLPPAVSNRGNKSSG